MGSKPVIAIDINKGKRGGPYISSMNLMNSSLKEDFNFVPIYYDNGLGRFISIKRIKDIVKQIKKASPDGILITGLQLSGFHVALASLISGVRTRIVIIRGSSTEAISFPFIKRICIGILEYLTLGMSTAFYGVSNYASQLSAAPRFRKKNRGYVYNIPCINMPTSPFAKRELGLDESDILISTSGRITKEKGFEVLLHTIKKISDPKIKFIIIGDGEYLTEMKKAIKTIQRENSVIFTGYTSRVMDYIYASDIFVLPTLHETLSVSLLEAASLSKPLISCNVGGVPEIIENNVNGLLVSPSQPSELAEAILKLSNNERMRSKFGKAAKKTVDTKFAKDKLINQVRDILNCELGNEKN